MIVLIELVTNVLKYVATGVFILIQSSMIPKILIDNEFFLMCGNLNAINFKVNIGAVLEHIYKMSLLIYEVKHSLY